MSVSWRLGGFLLGLVFFAAIALVKPIGVSTQFVIFDGLLWRAVDPSVVVTAPDAPSGYASPNAYLDKSGGKYAAAIADPLNYSFVFVIALMIGAALSSALRGGVGAAEARAPAVWRANFGDRVGPRYAVAFSAGVLVLYGARLAGGCTSGHMMSGMMQSAISGFAFSAAAFPAAILTARALYQKEV